MVNMNVLPEEIARNINIIQKQRRGASTGNEMLQAMLSKPTDAQGRLTFMQSEAFGSSTRRAAIFSCSFWRHFWMMNRSWETQMKNVSHTSCILFIQPVS